MEKTRLQYWRERRFLSKRQLAIRSKVHINTIVDIEKNRRVPRRETMENLAKVLEVSLDDLAESSQVA